MSTSTASEILKQLARVEALRTACQRDHAMSAVVKAVKTFQHTRFSRTYQDLLSSPRYRLAATFFLEELYGPKDFSDRDAQFARIVPALVRLFQAEIVRTVGALAELHALSEELDWDMATHLVGSEQVSGELYCRAWQRVGRAGDRGRQIDLMTTVGQALARFTKNPLLRHSLRLMRQPARASGLGALQRFLEAGFDTFASMPEPGTFLDLIAERERRLAQVLDGGVDAEVPVDMDFSCAVDGAGSGP